MKIWSLLPSATEILFALGAGEQVTGVTHECDYPPEVAKKPPVTMSYIDSSRDSASIDRQVSEHFQQGRQLYGIVEQRLNDDPPDLIITQDLCPVCAVSPSDFAAHMRASGCTATVVTLNPHLLHDVLDNIRHVGKAVEAERIAEGLIDSLLFRIDAVRSAMAGVDRPSVLTIEWLDPVMPGGHWVPEMVEIAGGASRPILPGEPSRKIPWEDLRELRPEVVVLMPCGFGPERAAAEAKVLWSLPGWALIPAVRKGRVFVVDGNAYFSRPGPRLVDGVELLAYVLHPARWRRPAVGSVFKLVSPPAGASSVENWAPRFEPLL